MENKRVRTETGPLAELLAILDLDERDLVLVAESDDELLVGLLLAVLVQDTHVSLATVKSLGSLTETTGKTVVHERELQDTLESVENGHLALRGLAGNLNNIGDLGGVVFYVRLHREEILANMSIFGNYFLVITPLTSQIDTLQVASAA